MCYEVFSYAGGEIVDVVRAVVRVRYHEVRCGADRGG